jgi:hypothetical protein
MKISSLQRRASEFTPKKFYEMGPSVRFFVYRLQPKIKFVTSSSATVSPTFFSHLRSPSEMDSAKAGQTTNLMSSDIVTVVRKDRSPILITISVLSNKKHCIEFFPSSGTCTINLFAAVIPYRSSLKPGRVTEREGSVQLTSS